MQRALRVFHCGSLSGHHSQLPLPFSTMSTATWGQFFPYRILFISASLTDIDNKGAPEAWISWLTVTSAQCRNVLSLLAVSTHICAHRFLPCPHHPMLEYSSLEIRMWVRSHVGDCRITLPGLLGSPLLDTCKCKKQEELAVRVFFPAFLQLLLTLIQGRWDCACLWWDSGLNVVPPRCRTSLSFANENAFSERGNPLRRIGITNTPRLLLAQSASRSRRTSGWPLKSEGSPR